MKIADLYIRVHSDNEAFALTLMQEQESLLREYCDSNKILIRNVICDNGSALSFNRAGWRKYESYIREHSDKENQVSLLFTRWDVFSRNAPDAYRMLNILNDNNILANAMQQPVDLAFAENKIMLAIFLATPENFDDNKAEALV